MTLVDGVQQCTFMVVFKCLFFFFFSCQCKFYSNVCVLTLEWDPTHYWRVCIGVIKAASSGQAVIFGNDAGTVHTTASVFVFYIAVLAVHCNTILYRIVKT